MTVEVDYELHPVTKLDFEPQCDMEITPGTNDQCPHAAVWSATVLHGMLDERAVCGTGGATVLFCTCCLTRLLALLEAWVPGLCGKCDTRIAHPTQYLTHVKRLDK